MFKSTLTVAVATLAASVSFVLAHEVTTVSADHGTIGDVLELTGSGFTAGKKKPKVTLTASPEVGKRKGKVPTIKLKVGDFTDTTLAAALQRVSKKTPAGTYDVRVAVKGQEDVVLPRAFELVGPTVDSADPDVAPPGNTVDLLVQDWGSRGKHSVEVGFDRADIVAEEDLGDGNWRITIRVPQIGSGLWPVTVGNSVGEHTKKSVLEVTGADEGKKLEGARADVTGMKPFKAKSDRVSASEEGIDQTNVGAVGGSKSRPVVLGITVASSIADLEVGDTFTGDDALILYSLTKKKGTVATDSWSTTANELGEDFSVVVTAKDAECFTLFICGEVRRIQGTKGPDVIEILGYATAPLETTVVDGPCNPETLATGSVTGAFDSEAQRNIGTAGVQGPGTFKFASGEPDNGDGIPRSVLNWTVSFDPESTPLPVTYNSIQPTGGGLTEFALQLADNTFWRQSVDPSLNTSMSVTITEVIPVRNGDNGLKACIRGTFTGTLTKADASMQTQTYEGTFEIPWFDTGFGR